MPYNLERFEMAHELYFQKALSEIRNGRKLSHWMWYIFPQIKGLGYSETSKHYAIENLEEANAFLQHATLSNNLLTITSTLLHLPTNNANSIFGTPDDMKLHSCMTLFALVPGARSLFQQVMDKYFDGKADYRTMELVK